MIGEFWTSGNDIIIESVYYWFGSGHRINYDNWGYGQPDNYENNEDCVVIYVLNNEMHWNDRNCAAAIKSICEIF